jgi:hypothetical protein
MTISQSICAALILANGLPASGHTLLSSSKMARLSWLHAPCDFPNAYLVLPS